MKYLLTLTFTLVISTAISAQCSLTLKDAPAIRGLRFGMSSKDVSSIIGMPLKIMGPAGSIWAYNPEIQLTDVKGLDGITLLKLGFESDRLIQIDIDYNLEVRWENAREFAGNISENLKLPMSAWTFEKTDERRAEMICKEFAVQIDTGLGGKLQLMDLVAQRSRRIDKNERADEWKKVFKP
jgi:hypothetical protein